VLLETIADFLSKKRSPYARLTNVFNSSGTGKSRIVDQLGIKIITVQMCLRLEGSQGIVFCSFFWGTYNLTLTGFPPPDNELRDWLLSGKPSDSQLDSQRRVYGFVYSLLTVTRTRLQTIETEGKGNYLFCGRSLNYVLMMSQMLQRFRKLLPRVKFVFFNRKKEKNSKNSNKIHLLIPLQYAVIHL
jgi:hypothetical protein